jgi:hypothetical protein
MNKTMEPLLPDITAVVEVRLIRVYDLSLPTSSGFVCHVNRRTTMHVL